MQVARIVAVDHVHDCAHGAFRRAIPLFHSLGIIGGLAVTTLHVGDTRSPHFFDPDAGRRICDNVQKGGLARARECE